MRSHGQELNSFEGKTVQIHTAGWHNLGRTARYRCFDDLRRISEVHSYQSQCNSIHEYIQGASALGFRVVWSFECMGGSILTFGARRFRAVMCTSSGGNLACPGTGAAL